MSRRHSDIDLGDVLDAVDKQAKALGHMGDVFLDRIEALEARSNSSGLIMGGGGNERIQNEHKQLFENWLRKSDDPQRMEKLNNIEGELNKKDVSIGSDIQGGHAVPEMIVRDIEKHELLVSPVRRLVRVIQASTSDVKLLLTERLPSGGSNWVSETGTRSATPSPTLRQIAPTHGELYAYPSATNWSLNDIFFNVADWLTMEVGDVFGQQTGQAVISGNGTNRPTGMLDTTPTLGEDFGSPLRAQAAYEYVVSDSDVDASPSSPAIRPDNLIDLVYKVRSQYRMNARFVMNSTTIGAVRKLKDSQNRYLWTDGLGEAPPRLLGYPVETWEDMQDVGAGNFPIAFGDFSRAYTLVDIQGMRIIRDQVTTPGYTKFYVSRRLAGAPWNNDAVKFLRTID